VLNEIKFSERTYQENYLHRTAARKIHSAQNATPHSPTDPVHAGADEMGMLYRRKALSNGANDGGGAGVRPFRPGDICEIKGWGYLFGVRPG
jgi:hypothetical protein